MAWSHPDCFPNGFPVELPHWRSALHLQGNHVLPEKIKIMEDVKDDGGDLVDEDGDLVGGDGDLVVGDGNGDTQPPGEPLPA